MLSKLKFSIKTALIIAFGAVLIVALLTLNPRPEPQPSAEVKLLEVPVFSVQLQTKAVEVKTQGTVQPRREVDLVAQVTGEIVFASKNFVDGGFVSKGDLLVKVDERDYQIELIRAESRLAEAEQLLATEKGRSLQAKREWRDLDNQDANQLFLREPQLKAAQANVEAARASREQAKLNLERTRVNTPFSGRISETMVDYGQYVTAGTKIARVYDNGTLEIRLPLTDRQASLIEMPLQQINFDAAPKVKISGSVAGRAQTWEGRIVRSDPSIDTRSRFYYVVAEVIQPQSKLASTESSARPLMVGLFVEAAITGRQINNVAVVPKSALFKGNNLFVVNNENKVREIGVKVIYQDAKSVWVTGEIETGENIVLRQQLLLTEGMEIKPVLQLND